MKVAHGSRFSYINSRSHPPDTFFYFDPIHPTAIVHRLISILIGMSLHNQGYVIDVAYLNILMHASKADGHQELFKKYFEDRG